ncbi:DNAse I-like superfamily protein [Actinidia rufa]|uniref:DNAse I-like superfamily protein n=1 Tax=Actinidia rufa TaxID=165716 RepID=A0A7J0GZJ5_9ERIC|nr:DNAse I-like superfamily protein [Actinidia rufa]
MEDDLRIFLFKPPYGDEGQTFKIAFVRPKPVQVKWKTRSRAILNLLKSLEPEFFCLQEVDEYDSFYEGNMESHGYASIYIQRSGKKPDGCGIFYKHDNAELILEEKIEYNDLVNSVQDGTSFWVDKDNDVLASGNKDTEHLSLQLAELVLEEKIKCNDLVNSIQDKTTSRVDKDNDALACGNKDTVQKDGLQQKVTDRHHGDPNDPRVRLKRDCVGIMGAFKLKDPSHHVVIVANTHLYWDPNWADVKLAQAKYLMARLAKFRTLVSDKFECRPSVFVAGDFNSTPGDKLCGEKAASSANLCTTEFASDNKTVAVDIVILSPKESCKVVANLPENRESALLSRKLVGNSPPISSETRSQQSIADGGYGCLAGASLGHGWCDGGGKQSHHGRRRAEIEGRERERRVYQYLISGSSSMGPSQECLEDLPIPLCSVYALTRGEPPFTNCTPGFTGTLDYIFFSPSDDIKPVSYLEIPEPGSPDVIGGLPNYHHPSDHLPIGAEFEVIGN